MGKTRRWLGFALSLLALGMVLRSVEARSPEARRETPTLAEDPLTGAILVDLDDDAGASLRQAVASRLIEAIAPAPWTPGAAALGEPISSAAQLFRLTPPAAERADVLRMLSGEEGVEGVEEERTWSLPVGAGVGIAANEAALGRDRAPHEGEGFQPNDPYYRHQWHMDLIGMPLAWTRSRGEGTVVAVVDTGVLYRSAGRFVQAPDLAETRFVEGHDFVDDDAHPDDEHGHGTHVAGTVAQSTDNGVGVTGVAPEASIMPVRVLDARGAGRWGAVAAGIRWAADHGAHVINLSLGGGTPSGTIRRAIEHARDRGVVVIAAAGNSGGRVGYPAAHASVFAVSAVRYDGELTEYSSRGRALDIAAPGGDLTVDQNGDGMPDGVLQNTMVRGDPARHDYLNLQGTSMASPHVAGVAALLHSAGLRQRRAIEDTLRSTARDRGDAELYGAGIVQAEAALASAQQGRAFSRGLAALAMGLFVLVGLRRRGSLDVGMALPIGVAFVVVGGLGVLPLHWAGSGIPTLAGLPTLMGALPPWLAPLTHSAVVPIAAATLLFGWQRGRPLLVGISLGTAAWLMLEALYPSASFVPWPSLLVGPWLVANATFAAWLGRLLARRT